MDSITVSLMTSSYVIDDRRESIEISSYVLSELGLVDLGVVLHML